MTLKNEKRWFWIIVIIFSMASVSIIFSSCGGSVMLIAPPNTNIIQRGDTLFFREVKSPDTIWLDKGRYEQWKSNHKR